MRDIERERIAELISAVAQKVVNTFDHQGIPAPLGKCICEFIATAKASDTQQELRELALKIVEDHEVALSLTISHRPVRKPKLIKGGTN